MDDPIRTVINRYSNSPAILQLVENFNEYFSPEANIEMFFDQVWNIETAEGYGLVIWGRIVGVGNTVEVANSGTFGWSQGGYTGFGQGPFAGGSGTTSNYILSDDAYRQAILAKALANITDGSTKAINQIMLNLFPDRGNCYVAEVSPLVIAYTFDFPLTPVEFAIVTQLNVLPRPCGVAATVVVP